MTFSAYNSEDEEDATKMDPVVRLPCIHSAHPNKNMLK